MARFVYRCGYNRPFLGGYESVAGYISAVLKRYTSRKAIEIEDAYSIAERLAYKYSGNTSTTLRSVGLNRHNIFHEGHYFKGSVTRQKWVRSELFGIYSDIESRKVFDRHGVPIAEV